MGADSADALVASAEAWFAQDPDPATRAETEALLAGVARGDVDAVAALRDQFGSRLGFGTAGLRGALGAGPNRMNSVLVAQAAAGFGQYLLNKWRFDSATPRSTTGVGSRAQRREVEGPMVIIGYDGRVNSDVFARDSAEVFAGLGLKAILLPRALPTPVLAFAVRHLAADAGVMVTASHNPAQDNGYKVYLGGADAGSQIVSPADVEIAAQIAEVADSVRFDELARGEYEIADESVIDAYIAETAAQMTSAGPVPTFVYTPMHGVGHETFMRVLDTAGFARPNVVVAQRDPDGSFPTVAFPNPEEAGALDLAFDLATEVGAELVVAHDPDADRLAVAIPARPSTSRHFDSEPAALRSMTGTWERLSGNDIGLLLGWQIARKVSSQAGDGAPNGTLACSMVSSPGLRAIAEFYQLDFVETPTGFKWISRAPDLVFGFEEALGYLVNPDVVRDKDGISASVAFLSLAADLAAQGKTIADHLDELVATFGCFASSTISIRVTDLADIDRSMKQLRAQPPATIGSHRVDRIEDLAEGFGEIPPSNVLRIWMADGSRVMVRPSGTEPKLKIYIDAVSHTGTVAERRDAANALVAELEAGMRALLG